MQCSVWLCHPRSTGTLTLSSADPADRPRIDFSLFEDERDAEDAARGVEIVRSIFGQLGLSGYHAGEVSPGPDVVGPNALTTFVRHHGRHGHHPIGTCAMGNADSAVVDPQLRVRGVERLWVADASVMPSLITGHTNAPTVMVAERAADFIRREA